MGRSVLLPNLKLLLTPAVCMFLSSSMEDLLTIERVNKQEMNSRLYFNFVVLVTGPHLSNASACTSSYQR